MSKPKIVVNSDARYSDPNWEQLAPVIVRDAPPVVREAAAGDIATPSPVRSLQAVIETALAEAPRWSARRRVAVMACVSLAGWIVLILGIRALF
jgi:hypothetical protein